MGAMAVGADGAIERRLGHRSRRVGPGTVVAAAANAIDVRAGKKLVGLDGVVLVGQVPVARTMTVDAGNLPLEVRALDKLQFHIDMALLASRQRILSWGCTGGSGFRGNGISGRPAGVGAT